MLPLLLAAALAIPPATLPSTGAAPMTMLPALPTLPNADRPGPDEQIGAVKVARALQEPTPEAQIKGLDEALLSLLRPTPFRGLVVCMRVSLAASLRSNTPSQKLELASAADECYQLRPSDPSAIALAASAAFDRKDNTRAAHLWIALLKVKPALGIMLPLASLESLQRNLEYDGQRRLAADLISALLRAGYSAGGADWSAHAAAQAVRDLVAAGDRQAAVALVPRVTEPTAAMTLLIDRRMAPIWEEMAPWAADGLIAQRDALIGADQATFDAEPTIEHRTRLAGVLAEAGRLHAAIALLRTGYDDTAAFTTSPDDAVDLSLKLANLLGQAEQVDAAAIVLRGAQQRLASVPSPKALSLPPNLARILIETKHFDEARQVLVSSRPPARGVGNPAMLAFYDALLICTDARSGQVERAQTALMQLGQSYPNNPTALSIAETCAGDLAGLRKGFLVAFDDPQRRAGALVAWLRIGATPQRHSLLANPAMDTALRHDPALIAAYEKYARPLPPQFADALAEWPDAEAATR